MKKCICIIIFLVLLIMPTFAQSQDGQTQADDITQDLVSDEVLEYFETQSITLEDVKNMTFTDILAVVFNEFSKVMKKPFVLFLKLSGVFVLAGVLAQFKTKGEAEGIQNAIDVCVTIAVFILVCKPCLVLLADIEATLNTAKNAMVSFVPVFASVMVSCGQPATAVIYSGLFLSMMAFVAMLLIKYILPFIKIFMALSITQGVSSSIQLSGITSFISKAIKWALGFLSTIFVGLLSVQTFISQGADSLSLRMGKFMIGSGIPVIGRAISEAAGTVFSGLKVIKGMVGIAGVIGLLGIFAPILISCICYQLVFMGAKAVAEALGNKRGAGVLQGFCECISIYIAVILFFLLLLIFSTIIMIFVGTGGV